MSAVTGTYDNIVDANATLAITAIAGAPNAYIVHDIDGSVIASGAVSGTTVSIPAPAGGWPGWFLLLFTSPTWNAQSGFVTDAAQITTKRNIGVWPPLPPAGTSPAASDPNGRQMDQYMHGQIRLGLQRYQIRDPANPTVFAPGSEQCGTIASIQACAALDNGAAGYTNPAYADPDRPVVQFVQFPNQFYTEAGYSAGVAQTVAAIGPSTAYGIKYFEGLNEPFNAGLNPAQSAAQYDAFHDAVIAGNANAVPIGPGEVSLCPIGALGIFAPDCTFLRSFLQSLTRPLKGFSVHGYNAFNGDFVAFEGWWKAWIAELTNAGYANVPKFLTENSVNSGGDWNVFDPNRIVSLVAQLYLIPERFGCPKEHIYWFFDSNIGFDVFGLREPSRPELRMAAGVVRVIGEQVYGKAYASALDMGPVGSYFCFGNIYRGSTGCCVALMAAGNPDETITLAISDSVSTVSCAKWDGRTFTVNVINGQIQVPISHLPTYVTLSRNCTVSVADVGRGMNTMTNLARTAVITSKTGSPSPDLLNNGLYETGGYLPAPDTTFASVSLPEELTWTWTSPQNVGGIQIRGVNPWFDVRRYSTMIDGKLEYWDGAQWLACPTEARAHWNDRGVYHNETATSFLGRLGATGIRAITWFDAQWCFNVRFRFPVRMSKMRWTVTKVSITEVPDLDAASIGLLATPGLNVPSPRLDCSEVLIYEDNKVFPQILGVP